MHLHIKVHNSIYLIHYSCVLTDFFFLHSCALVIMASRTLRLICLPLNLSTTNETKLIQFLHAKWFINRKLKNSCKIDSRQLFGFIVWFLSSLRRMTINWMTGEKSYKHEKVKKKKWIRNLRVKHLRVGVYELDTHQRKETNKLRLQLVHLLTFNLYFLSN